MDCFKSFPEEYRGKFDVINIRFWLCVVNDDSADALLTNILTLLSMSFIASYCEACKRD